jgi:hypothetical protein
MPLASHSYMQHAGYTQDHPSVTAHEHRAWQHNKQGINKGMLVHGRVYAAGGQPKTSTDRGKNALKIQAIYLL